MKKPKVKKPRDHSAIGKKSKGKGDRNEREIVKIFKSWWGEGEWARTPRSGGWGKTQQYRADFNTAGDVITTATDFPFVIEVKSEEGWHLEHLIRSPETCLITKWWGQTIGETTPGKLPMLVFTRNQQPWYVMIQNDFPVVQVTRRVATFHPMMTTSHLKTVIFLLDHLTEIPREQILEMIQGPQRKGMTK